MDFEKFKETIRQDLLENLPQLEKAGIEFRDVEKLQNQSYTAMSITPENSSIGASVNIEKYYQQMENGRPYDEVLDVLSEEVVQIMEEIPQVDAVALTDYESMKPHLMVQMVSTERNQEMLAKVPHILDSRINMTRLGLVHSVLHKSLSVCSKFHQPVKHNRDLQNIQSHQAYPVADATYTVYINLLHASSGQDVI